MIFRLSDLGAEHPNTTGGPVRSISQSRGKIWFMRVISTYKPFKYSLNQCFTFVVVFVYIKRFYTCVSVVNDSNKMCIL